MHLAPDPVSDERANDRQAGGLDVLLDGVRDVTEPVARDVLIDRQEQRLLGDPEQLGRDGLTGPTGKVRAASDTQPS